MCGDTLPHTDLHILSLNRDPPHTQAPCHLDTNTHATPTSPLFHTLKPPNRDRTHDPLPPSTVGLTPPARPSDTHTVTPHPRH